MVSRCCTTRSNRNFELRLCRTTKILLHFARDIRSSYSVGNERVAILCFLIILETQFDLVISVRSTILLLYCPQLKNQSKKVC